MNSAFCCSGSSGVAAADGEAGEASSQVSDTAVDCAANGPAQDLWSCAFEFYECSVSDDIACVVDDDGEGVASGVNGVRRRSARGGRRLEISLYCFSFCVALVLGLVPLL